MAIESGFNNAGELMGLDGAMNGELSAFLGSLDPVSRAAVIQKLTKKAASMGSRAEFEKHFKELPDHVKQGLLKGDLRLTDYMLYAVKQVTSKTVKMFEPQDVRETSMRNVANAKLPKNFVFVVSGIFLLAGVPTDLTADKIKATDYKTIKDFPAITTGEHYFKANKQHIIAENNANRSFVTDNNHYVNLGYKKLHNPRLIRDEEVMEFVLELGTMDGLDAKTHVFVGLDGTGTTP